MDTGFLSALNTPDLVNGRLSKIQLQKAELLKLDQRYYYNEKLEPYTLHITYINEPASLQKYATTMSDALTNMGIKSDLTQKDNQGLADMLKK